MGWTNAHGQNQEMKIPVLPRLCHMGVLMFCSFGGYMAFKKNQLLSKDDSNFRCFVFLCHLPPPPPFSPLPQNQVIVLTRTSVLPWRAPWGLIVACHLLTEINFSFRCLSFSFLFAKKKPQDVVVCCPWKWSSTETCCHLLPSSLYTCASRGWVSLCLWSLLTPDLSL